MPIKGIYFHRIQYLFSHPGFLSGKISKNGIEFAFCNNVELFGFILNKAAICLDNLRPLEPNLIILGPLSHDGMDRFVSATKMMDRNLPVLILSSDRSLNGFAAYNGFKDVEVLQKNSDQEISLLAGFSNFRKTLRDLKNLSLKNTCGGFVMGAEKAIIKKTLERTNWNRKKAAGLLSISYKSLLNEIKKYRL